MPPCSSSSITITINFSRHPSPVIIVRCRYHPPTPVSEDHQPSSVVILNYARLPIIVYARLKFYRHPSSSIITHRSRLCSRSTIVVAVVYRCLKTVRHHLLHLRRCHRPFDFAELKMSHRSVSLSVCIL